MKTRHDSIAIELVTRLVQPESPSVPLTATMRYEPSDPFAVTVDFHTGPITVVTWTFARELLRAGVDAPSGEGDVQIWPERLGAGPVTLLVASSNGRAVFILPRRKVLEFLARTYAAVPLGTESRYVDVDALIETLAGGAAG